MKLGQKFAVFATLALIMSGAGAENQKYICCSFGKGSQQFIVYDYNNNGQCSPLGYYTPEHPECKIDTKYQGKPITYTNVSGFEITTGQSISKILNHAKTQTVAVKAEHK